LNALDPAPRLIDKRRDLGDGIRDRHSDHCVFAASNQPFRRTIENIDAPFGIEADNAGANSREHGLRKAAPCIDLIARTDDVVALRAQLVCHRIEAVAEAG
jgi:hypothetical protein